MSTANTHRINGLRTALMVDQTIYYQNFSHLPCRGVIINFHNSFKYEDTRKLQSQNLRIFYGKQLFVEDPEPHHARSLKILRTTQLDFILGDIVSLPFSQLWLDVCLP